MAKLERPHRVTDTARLSPEEQLRKAIRAAGLSEPDTIALDGQLHRFASAHGDKSKAGWYVAHGDGIPAGRFGCWRRGVDEGWRADIGRPLTPAEEVDHARRLAELRALREAQQEAKHATAADTVAEIWHSLQEADATHPYLARKGVRPHGARVTGDGRLVVPLFDQNGTLASLQYIDFDGSKRYHPGAQTRDCWALIGELDGEGAIYIAEGYATGATIHEVTGRPVAVAYSAGNLPGVAEQICAEHGAARVVVVADNDKSGVGQSHAEQAAAKTGCAFVVPPTPGDANDYVQSGRDLAELLRPKASDWLIPADDFSSQPAPLSWLIRGWLQEGALHMAHGPSGGGKTFVVLDWCLRMASGGGEWFGAKVKPGPVIYLAGEGHHGLRGRVAAWKARHEPQGPLRLWVSRDGCDLDQPDGLHRVVAAIQSLQVRPSMIVVDTLHRFLKGDENSAQDAKAMLDSCAALISEFGAAVLLVHHTGVGDEAQARARGSSAWRGALDVEISIYGSKEKGITIKQRKNKDAEAAADVSVALEQVEIPGWIDEDGAPVSSAVIVAGKPREKEDEPVKVKTSKTHDHMRRLENAWHSSGTERTASGAPYVSKAALLRFLVGDCGMSDASARQILKPSNTGRLVADLLDAGWIRATDHGWEVTHAPTANAMLVSLSAPKWEPGR
jgi:putative DNA primase/helicase